MFLKNVKKKNNTTCSVTLKMIILLKKKKIYKKIYFLKLQKNKVTQNSVQHTKHNIYQFKKKNLIVLGS